MLVTRFAAVLAFALTSALAAHAMPISGQFSITGGSVSNDGSTLTFDPDTIRIGSQDTLYGDFATLLHAGEKGTITSSIDYADYVPDSAKLVFGTAGNKVKFVLTSLTEMSSGDFGLFTGTGIISTQIAGYDPTEATLLFSTQGSGVTTFSATAATSPVPEPSTLALLGTGLFGAAGAARRRFLRA